MKEYKAIKVKWDYKLEKINETMNEMAKEGWNVVSVSPAAPQMTMDFVITFCREAEHESQI